MEVPFNIGYTFDSNLRDVPVAPDEMARAITYLEARIATGEHGHREQARILGRMGVLCRILYRLDEAQAHLERAVMICHELSDARCEVVNTIRLAHVYQWQGKFDKSDPRFLQVLELCEREPALSDYLDFACQHYGKSLFDQGRYEEAAEMFRRALKLRMRAADSELVGSSRMALQAALARSSG